jgi:hypothetical protein
MKKMIVIIDPIVSGFSHEMVNAGFVYSVSKDNPDKKILFIAEEKHVECIKDIFSNNNYEANNIKYVNYNNIVDFIKINIRLLSYSKKNLIENFVFLSFNAVVVAFIYKFIRNTQVYLISHAILESIIGNENQRENLPRESGAYLEKIRTSSLKFLAHSLWKRINKFIKEPFNKNINKLFNFKNLFLNESRGNVTYILLSEHIKINLLKLNVLHGNKIKVVTMPYIFPKFPSGALSKKLNNFGILGYGNPKVMKEIVDKINRLCQEEKYTFWNIGGNTNGLKNIKNLKTPVSGRFLTRSEIDRYAKELDFTLILYDKDSYTLSCSAAILESILYLRPIIYLDNSCINEFNKANIGIKCNSLEYLIEIIADIIKNPVKYEDQFAIYKKNILDLQNNLNLNNRSLFNG